VQPRDIQFVDEHVRLGACRDLGESADVVRVGLGISWPLGIWPPAPECRSPTIGRLGDLAPGRPDGLITGRPGDPATRRPQRPGDSATGGSAARRSRAGSTRRPHNRPTWRPGDLATGDSAIRRPRDRRLGDPATRPSSDQRPATSDSAASRPVGSAASRRVDAATWRRDLATSRLGGPCRLPLLPAAATETSAAAAAAACRHRNLGRLPPAACRRNLLLLLRPPAAVAAICCGCGSLVRGFPPVSFDLPRARLLSRNEPAPHESSKNPTPTRAKGPFARDSLRRPGQGFVRMLRKGFPQDTTGERGSWGDCGRP
jgi:hypothetical protein